MTILCADDFGLTPGISEGILALCRQGKLNAVSVMTEAPPLPAYSAQLLVLAGAIQIGLHFNLTIPFGRRAYSHISLMLRPWLSSAERADIAVRLKDQMHKFEEHFGGVPNFIDGHEHVHVMPSVRKIFLDEIAHRYGTAPHKPWIRQVANPVFDTDAHFKAFVLNVLNLGFSADCAHRGFKTNGTFRGVYSLAPGAPFERLVMRWLCTADSSTLFMFHPSLQIEDNDVISCARVAEYKILSSWQTPSSSASTK